ncbi:MAG: hypothetical protein ACHP84_00595 [Caulobacterales bacterium]
MTARGAGAARPLSPIRWLGLPMLFCAVATVVFATPIKVFGLQLPQPVFALVPAFAWAVIRPSILPPFALLVLGLFLDVFGGGVHGLWPLCLLVAYAATLSARRLIFNQDFLVTWAWYALIATAAFAVAYIVMTMNSGAPLALLACAWPWLTTVALFPFAHRLIQRYEDADVRFR